MNFYRVLLTSAVFAIAGYAGATELLFSGIVQRQTMVASGTPDCARPCPASPGPDADGITHVCISNAGGCQVAEITVLHDYLGTSGHATERFKTRTGEFGGLNFPDTTTTILVHAVDGDARWTMLASQDGVDVIDASDRQLLKRFARLHPGTLTPDAGGKLAVTQLVSHIQP